MDVMEAREMPRCIVLRGERVLKLDNPLKTRNEHWVFIRLSSQD